MDQLSGEIDITKQILKHGIPNTWSDSLKMQTSLSNVKKGWKVNVSWKQSDIPNAGMCHVWLRNF